jgi:hypothetical protein
MEMAIPEADPVAYNRMKYEIENRDKPGLVGHAFGVLKRGPDVGMAAKSGEPAMTSLRPTVPVSVPVPAEAGAGFAGDVTATTITDSTALDTQPDARGPRPAGATDAIATPPTSTTDVTGSVAQPNPGTARLMPTGRRPPRHKAAKISTRRTIRRNNKDKKNK